MLISARAVWHSQSTTQEEVGALAEGNVIRTVRAMRDFSLEDGQLWVAV